MTLIPNKIDRYYSFLPEEISKFFDERYLKNPKYYNRDKKQAEEKWYGDDIINRKANEYALSKFPYYEFIRTNAKYKYDTTFTYLVKWDRFIVLLEWYIYSSFDGASCNRIFFIDPITEEQLAYGVGSFKNIWMMLPAESIKYMGQWQTAYDKFYTHYQRLQHPDTINLLKTVDKYKYIPVEKFHKINYFRLLNAASPAIYQYELLIKMGANKLAYELLMRHEIWSKKDIIKYKHEIINKKSYYFINQLIRKDIKIKEEQEERMKLMDIDVKLRRMKKLFYDIGKYILKSPESLKDMQHESNILNHCLGKSQIRRYATEIVNNEGIILFLRDKNNIDDPYYTLEIKNGELIQCRTSNNETSADIQEIVKEWLFHNKEILFNEMQAQ